MEPFANRLAVGEITNPQHPLQCSTSPWRGTLKKLLLYNTREYIEARKKDVFYSRDLGIDWAMEKYKVDALVFPASSVASLAAKAGYPSIAIPVGFLDSGEPFGISITATAWQEGLLIEIASGYEAVTNHRRDPECAKIQ